MGITIQIDGHTINHPARYSCNVTFADGSNEHFWSDDRKDVIAKFDGLKARADVSLVIAFDFVAGEDIGLGGNGREP